MMRYQEYRRRVDGCFTGKAVGGTLGMPFEGSLQTRVLTGYDPVPTEMVANDDLDLQVINLEIVRRFGLPVNRCHLSTLWAHMQDAGPDEYGAARWNYNLGRKAPLSGYYCNKFYAGMGAAIRSELWACLAPGDPALAVRLAREDACTDHYDDGIHASLFLTAVESAAFTQSDFTALVETGLRYLPGQSRLALGLRDSIACWEQTRDPYAARELFLAHYGVQNWTDVTVNLGLILIAWLSSGGDFSKAICTAAGLGYDADCTCATLGSILGIIHPEGIGREWTKPIGNKLVLSPQVMGLHEPETIDGFCDLIAATALDIQRYYASPVQLTDVPERISRLTMHAPWTLDASCADAMVERYESMLATQPLITRLIYPQAIALTPQCAADFTLMLRNPLPHAMDGQFALSVPDGWRVSSERFSFSLPLGGEMAFRFTVSVPAITKHTARNNPLDIDFQTAGACWTVTADLPTSIPWLRKNLLTGEEARVEAAQVFQTVPRGAWKYRTALKVNERMLVKIGVYATRAFTAYLNGEKLTQGDGSYYVPAFHRGRTQAKAETAAGWNIIEIEVADGEEGELFFGIGRRHTCSEWLIGAEYSLAPFKESGRR